MSELQELLAKLRAAKNTKGLSYQDIVDITEENGEAVSLSTVKRIFQRDSDLGNFRYHQTVRPVIRAVLGLDEETDPPAENPTAEQAEQYYTIIEAMKSVIDLKGDQLAEKTAELERLRAEQKEDLRRVEEREQKKVDYLKRIVDDLQSSTKWYKRVILVLGIVSAIFIVLLIADLSLGGYGWIRY